jgi:hypothetical protein
MVTRKPSSPQTDAFKWFLNPWVLGIAILLACFLFASTIVLLWVTRPGPRQNEQITAEFNVLPAPTINPTAERPTSLATPTSAQEAIPSPMPGVIAIGAYVQVVGTGGDGLRLRSEPGLNGQVRLLASEAEVFRVNDGPQELDDYTWWYLIGPFDETRQGWAVSNYLQIVQNP